MIYPNTVMLIVLYKLHNGTEYFFWDLMHLTHAMVGDALDNVWHM